MKPIPGNPVVYTPEGVSNGGLATGRAERRRRGAGNGSSPDLATIALELLDRVAALSSDGEGVSRSSYGEIETETMELLEAFATEQGLSHHRDRGANVVFQLDDSEPEEFLLLGSHLDSVPHGGNFDGLAGVVAGLLLLVDFRANGIRPGLPVRVIGFRGEESAWFGHACVGSRALVGQLTPDVLKAAHRDSGRSLEACMKSVGVDTAAILRKQPLLDLRRIRLFLELHIEQGPVLVERGVPVASVTGIRGNIRHRRVRCIGASGHSGAVPRWLRRDAVFAVSDLIMRLDDHWQTIQQHGGDLVVTVGILHTDSKHDAMSRVPGEAEFSFEARSESRSTLDALEALLRSECEALERDRKVRFEFDPMIRSDPATCEAPVVEGLQAACRSLDLPDESIPSGAGHDAAILANVGVPTGMIFIRNENGSHNPAEAMDIEDFMAGYSVLRRFLLDNY